MADTLTRKYTVTVEIPRTSSTLAMIDDLEELLMELGTARHYDGRMVSEVEVEAPSLFDLGWRSCEFVQEEEQKLRCAGWEIFTIECAD